MPLLGKTREPPCRPYYYTFGLVVAANVHPQSSGTRSLRPDVDHLARYTRGVARRSADVRDTEIGIRRYNTRASTESRQSWKQKRKKSHCSLAAPTSTPPPSRSVSTSTTSGFCASFTLEGISYAHSITRL